MRESIDQFRKGQLQDGYDYDLQVWVKGGRIQDCGHPHGLRPNDHLGCNGHNFAGQELAKVRVDLGL